MILRSSAIGLERFHINKHNLNFQEIITVSYSPSYYITCSVIFTFSSTRTLSRIRIKTVGNTSERKIPFARNHVNPRINVSTDISTDRRTFSSRRQVDFRKRRKSYRRFWRGPPSPRLTSN